MWNKTVLLLILFFFTGFRLTAQNLLYFEIGVGEFSNVNVHTLFYGDEIDVQHIFITEKR